MGIICWSNYLCNYYWLFSI